MRRRPVADLYPMGGNPRYIRPERLTALARALEEAPGMLEARPIVALPTGEVIMGAQRLAALTDTGAETVEVLEVDLDRARAIQWAVRDNVGYGEWDPDGLAEWVTELHQAGRDLHLTGLEQHRTDALLESTGAGGDWPDGVPEQAVTERVVFGRYSTTLPTARLEAWIAGLPTDRDARTAVILERLGISPAHLIAD